MSGWLWVLAGYGSTVAVWAVYIWWSGQEVDR
jgi:hypothetical protein